MKKPILVTGATGYIGGRLIPRLLDAGYRVRAMGRSPEKLRNRRWSKHSNVELVFGNAMDQNSLLNASAGCGVVYYLVHSMNPSQKDFAAADLIAARNTARAAALADVERIVYLGGLGEKDPELSAHLKSRHETGDALREGSVPVTEFRAAMIIGSGSASFEILRYLVDRLPVMITPRWVRTQVQPIAVANVLEYLVQCLKTPETVGEQFDIGGPEAVTYQELMALYAKEAGLLRRWCIPVPVLTPRLSSHWIHFVTPVPASIARPLAEGLRNPVVCRDNRIRELIPQDLLDCQTAFRRALRRLREHAIESHWTDAGEIPPVEWSDPNDPQWAGGTLYKDRRSATVSIPPEALWRSLSRIGGENGWYYGNALWKIRGFLDRLFGGVGLTRGRRHPEVLRPGDALDLWRVKKAVPNKRLLLVAEMKLPGKAVLDFEIEPTKDGLIEIKQTALFLPDGLLGIAYWYGVSPLHDLVFEGMLRRIVKLAQNYVGEIGSNPANPS